MLPCFTDVFEVFTMENVKIVTIKHVRILIWNVLIHASFSSRTSALTRPEFKCKNTELILLQEAK